MVGFGSVELPNATHIKAAASDNSGSTTFFLHDDWVGSSLYPETEGPEINEPEIECEKNRGKNEPDQHKRDLYPRQRKR